VGVGRAAFACAVGLAPGDDRHLRIDCNVLHAGIKPLNILINAKLNKIKMLRLRVAMCLLAARNYSYTRFALFYQRFRGRPHYRYGALLFSSASYYYYYYYVMVAKE
jgi:hypothetical protein